MISKKKNYPIRVVLGLLFIAICWYWIYPFVWMLSASLKTQLEVFKSGSRLIPAHPEWQNYVNAWISAGFGRYTFNTIVVTGGSVLLSLFLSCTAGYILGRFKFIGKSIISALLIATFIVPQSNTIIPIVQISRALGTLNHLGGIILVLGGAGQTANILLFMGYFSKVPSEMEESARMDGASFATTFYRIMVPLATPIVATVAVMSFLSAWNAFFVPLVFTFSRPSLRTLAVGMMAFSGTHETDWPGMAAAGTIALVPVVVFFFFVQRYFVEGLSGAVKG